MMQTIRRAALRALPARRTPTASATHALKLAALILGFCTVTAIGACSGGGDGPTTPPKPSAAGDYELMEVEGTELPVTLSGGSNTLVIRGGALELDGDNQFTLELDIVFNGQSGTLPLEGEYTVDGDNLEFEAERNDFEIDGFEGELDGDEMTVNGILGLEYQFERDGSARSAAHRVAAAARP